jgi:hypothetical protein
MSFTEKTRRLHNVADIMYHLFQKNRHFCCSSLPAYILCPKPTNNISSQCRQNTDNLRTKDCTNTLEKNSLQKLTPVPPDQSPVHILSKHPPF